MVSKILIITLHYVLRLRRQLKYTNIYVYLRNNVYDFTNYKLFLGGSAYSIGYFCSGHVFYLLNFIFQVHPWL